MNTKKITDAEMAPLRVASLPTRPTASSSFGGGGYTSNRLKAEFDKLPELIAARLNSLIEDINDGSLTEARPTGVDSPSTLGEFFAAMESGELCELICLDGKSLKVYLEELRRDIDALKK